MVVEKVPAEFTLESIYILKQVSIKYTSVNMQVDRTHSIDYAC